jgi:hypothetical protein
MNVKSKRLCPTERFEGCSVGQKFVLLGKMFGQAHFGLAFFSERAYYVLP